MKFVSALLILILCSINIYSQVVINELLYNPQGSDSGYEWIELYNNGSQNVNLNGWKIQRAGTVFETCFTFEGDIIIHSGQYLLIGEEFVQNADILAELSFQNGGSATDGVRLLSRDDTYSDTVLYDSPNTNNLTDDTGNIAQSFAPDVASGHSLARIVNGSDTNSAEDWFEAQNPTPKEANIVPIDLAISDITYTQNGSNFTLLTTIQNLSTINVDNFDATLDISINQEVIAHIQIPFITMGDSTVITYEISQIGAGYHIVECKINLLQDNQIENNSKALSILYGPSPFIINELMIKPQNDDNEWVEIFNRNPVDNFVDNLYIQDRTSGKITLYGQITDFLVICKNIELFMEKYPFADTAKVIESSSWASLNNTTENLYLKDIYGTVLDTLYYNAYHLNEDISYERVNPYSDLDIVWAECIDTTGATPTLPNSNLPKDKNIAVKFIKIESSGNLLKHFIEIYNCGLQNLQNASFSCYMKNVNDDFYEIYSSDIVLNDTLYLNFDTDFPEYGYYTFKYEISGDEYDYDNICYGFFNNNALPLVINEIMYNPSNGEPEWIEIYKNYQITELDSFYLKVGNDSFKYRLPDDDYFLITSSQEDAETLQELYNLPQKPLVGLSTLSNTGKELSLYDKRMNEIEAFTYDPAWNNKEKGVSIERINPTLKADYRNFGPCVNNATPQRQNSLFVQALHPKSKLYISPNPFSPHQSEHTIINYKLTKPINKITVRIFDLKGRQVNIIKENSLSSAEGSIIWDGRDKSGKILPIGVYIVHFTAVGTMDNHLYQKAKTVVIRR